MEAPERSRLQDLVQNAIDILRVMNENVVARKAAAIIGRCFDRLKGKPGSEPPAGKWDGLSFDAMFGEGMMTEMQRSFPFDVTSWDGASMFPWTNFGSQNLPDQTPDSGS